MVSTMTTTVLLSLVLAQAPSLDPYILWKSPSGEVPPGAVLKAVAPVFPADLPDSLGDDTVVLEVWLNGSGLVKRSRATSGPSSAQLAALRAISRWVFQPFLKDQAQPLRVTFTFRTLPRDAPEEDLATVIGSGMAVRVCRTQPAEPQP
jgi:hypothetical protein